MKMQRKTLFGISASTLTLAAAVSGIASSGVNAITKWEESIPRTRVAEIETSRSAHPLNATSGMPLPLYHLEVHHPIQVLESDEAELVVEIESLSRYFDLDIRDPSKPPSIAEGTFLGVSVQTESFAVTPKEIVRLQLRTGEHATFVLSPRAVGRKKALVETRLAVRGKSLIDAPDGVEVSVITIDVIPRAKFLGLTADQLAGMQTVGAAIGVPGLLALASGWLLRRRESKIDKKPETTPAETSAKETPNSAAPADQKAPLPGR